MSIEKGSAFWLQTPPNGEHLFFVITEPTEETIVVCVNMTTVYDFFGEHDKSCILQPGCHGNVKQLSYINYADAECVKVDEIETRIKNGIARLVDEKASPSVLRSIQKGFLESDALPRKFFKYQNFF